MGFGILTIGYYITYLVGMLWKNEIWGALLILVGAIAITMALFRLTAYEQGFRRATFFNIFLILFAAYRVCAWIFSELLLWELGIFSGAIAEGIEILEFLVFLAFQVMLLLAIRSLAADVENERIVSSSTRNLVFLGLFAVVQLLATLPLSFAVYFRPVSMLVQVVYHLLIGVMLGSCYMRICDEGDEDMPLKKSRFAWLNRFREERARREQKAVDSVTEYAEGRLRKKQEKRERALRELDERIEREKKKKK